MVLDIHKIMISPLDSCCYIISPGDNQKAVIIDPGGDCDKIIDYLDKKSLDPVLLINTHGHGDHIGGNKELKEKYPNIQICIHSDDAEMLEDPYKNLSLLGGVRYSSPPADRILAHDDSIVFDNYTFRVIHLPGHTRGGIGIYINSAGNGDSPVLFSGDTLFAGGIGKTNFPGGNFDALIKSIKCCIFNLDENTILHPGHGPSSTIKLEKKSFDFDKQPIEKI